MRTALLLTSRMRVVSPGARCMSCWVVVCGIFCCCEAISLPYSKPQPVLLSISLRGWHGTCITDKVVPGSDTNEASAFTSYDHIRLLISTLSTLRMRDPPRLRFRQSRELMISDVGVDVKCISSHKSLLPVVHYAGSHSLACSLRSVFPMDPRLNAQNASIPLGQNNSYLPEALIPGGLMKQQSRTSPLPQTQWSKIPPANRPQNYSNPPEQQEFYPSGTLHDWRLRPRIPGHALSRADPPQSLRPRRRPNVLEDLPHRQLFDTEEQIVDISLLYPQLSPYDSSASIHSAPDELEHIPRSISKPNTPSLRLHPLQIKEPDPAHQLPRSPTYPPAGRRRMHSATGVGDAAFADEEEFRLFVQATVGLGPEQAFKVSHGQSSSSSSDGRRSRSGRISLRQLSRPDIDASPTEMTLSPSTARALQEVAQMPGTSCQSLRRVMTSVSHHPGGTHDYSRMPTRQRLQTSASGLDLWLEPPSATTAGSITEPVEDLDNLFQPEDDLPDYASSQAQAQAAQRIEATRRAQELQRRWHASGRCRD